nr:YkvA family protein [Pantoea sp. 201603H]
MFRRLARFKTQLMTMWYACRHPETPLYIKLLMAVIVMYVISPVDIIPDVIPVIGWLDDAIIVPIGVGLLLKLLPEEVRLQGEARRENNITGQAWRKGFSRTLWGILLLWLMLLGYVFFHRMS